MSTYLKIMRVKYLCNKKQPLAFNTHCFSHSLNLCLSKASEVTSIKNITSIVGHRSNIHGYTQNGNQTFTLILYLQIALSILLIGNYLLIATAGRTGPVLCIYYYEKQKSM